VDAPPAEQLPADDTVPVREPIGARAGTTDSRPDDSHGLDDTRTDTPRVTDTTEPRTAPETFTPPNTAVEETHVAGSPTSRDSDNA
jgi:hypothetical protein